MRHRPEALLTQPRTLRLHRFGRRFLAVACQALPDLIVQAIHTTRFIRQAEIGPDRSDEIVLTVMCESSVSDKATGVFP